MNKILFANCIGKIARLPNTEPVIYPILVRPLMSMLKSARQGVTLLYWICIGTTLVASTTTMATSTAPMLNHFHISTWIVIHFSVVSKECYPKAQRNVSFSYFSRLPCFILLFRYPPRSDVNESLALHSAISDSARARSTGTMNFRACEYANHAVESESVLPQRKRTRPNMPTGMSTRIHNKVRLLLLLFNFDAVAWISRVSRAGSICVSQRRPGLNVKFNDGRAIRDFAKRAAARNRRMIAEVRCDARSHRSSPRSSTISGASMARANCERWLIAREREKISGILSCAIHIAGRSITQLA